MCASTEGSQPIFLTLLEFLLEFLSHIRDHGSVSFILFSVPRRSSLGYSPEGPREDARAAECRISSHPTSNCFQKFESPAETARQTDNIQSVVPRGFGRWVGEEGVNGTRKKFEAN